MTLLPLDPLLLVLVIPFTAAGLLMLVPSYRLGAALNVAASFLTFAVSVSLFFYMPITREYLLIDDLNIVFIVLNTFVGFTTSIFSAGYIAHELEIGRLTPLYLRYYHAMYQILMFAMNLAVVTNIIGLMWVAVELATLTTVLMVGIYRTPEALEAAWKYFILGSVGIALALFGTILVYVAAQPVIGEGLAAMRWTDLLQHVAGFDPILLNIAFVFLLLGYGTKAGLVPLHAWLPDAHAEGPTPISAVLSGLLLNVAFYAILRFKVLLAGNAGVFAPGPLLIALGLLSLLVRGADALSPPRHQTSLRLFLDRAHGHHRVCLRHRRPAREFRGPAAYGDAQPDEVGNLLCHRSYHPHQRLPAHRRHHRPDRKPSRARLDAGRRCRGDCRASPVRRVHQRVPGGEFGLRALSRCWRSRW